MLVQVAYVAGTALGVVATASAIRDRQHRAFAAWAASGPCIDLVRLFLARPADIPRPFVGWDRVIYLLDRVMVAHPPFTMLALALFYFVRPPRWIWISGVVVPFLISVAIAMNYPAVRGPSYGLLLTTSLMYGVVLSWVAMIYGLRVRRGIVPRYTHLCVMFAGMGELVTFAVVALNDIFGAWNHVRLVNVMLGSACLIAHAAHAARTRSTRVDAVPGL